MKRTDGFQGDVTISVSGLPPNVTAKSPVRIPRSEESGTLTLSTRRTTAFQKTTITVTGLSLVNKKPMTHHQTVTLLVSRALGEFRETVPDVRRVGQTRRSPDRKFLLKIERGRDAGIPQAYAATFLTVVGEPRRASLGFYMDSSSKQGGGGFCAGSTAGVVLSANPITLEQRADYTVAFLSLHHPQVAPEFEVHSTNGLSFMQPRVFFSPDCTLVAFIGANLAGPNRKASP